MIYRIIKNRENLYYPQYKFLWFFRNIKKSDYVDYSFKTIKEAEAIIKNMLNNDALEKQKRLKPRTEIIKTYDSKTVSGGELSICEEE